MPHQHSSSSPSSSFPSPSSLLAPIASKIYSHERITTADAVSLYQHASLEDLKTYASWAKSRYHPPDQASYLIMGIINYTNICVAKCDYCAFYRLPHQKDEGYLLTTEEICRKIDDFSSLNVNMVAFNGGFHPGLSIHDYTSLFAEIHQRYPHLGFYDMTVAEFMFVCKRSRVSYAQGAQLFKEAHTSCISGGGAEILTDSFRQRHSPGKYTTEDYYRSQQAILEAGIGSTATMVIGFDETLEERMQHLQRLREFQDYTQRQLPSFLCWTYKPDNTAFGGQEISFKAYLRWIAVCRIYLDNFVHVRASVLTQNHQALEAIGYGANDFDLPIEDEVTQSAGTTISHEFDRILRYGQDQGYTLHTRAPWFHHSSSGPSASPSPSSAHLPSP